jgi:hypothetical protein
MTKEIITVLFLATAPILSNASLSNYKFTYNNMYTAPTKGDQYTKTGATVKIYTEAGTCKGSFDVYLHKGKKFISFQNSWICIQGKSRFGYNGIWYIIK